MVTLTYKKNGVFMQDVNGFSAKTMINYAELLSGFSVTFECHNVTIMKNAQGDRVIIQEVK